MKVTGLFIYPIKSCRGIAVDKLEVGPRGPTWDRRWMLVTPDNRFLSQRTCPKMATIRTTLRGHELRVEAPGMSELRIPEQTASSGLSVTVWKDTVPAVVSTDEVNHWFSKCLGMDVRLVRLADGSTRRRVRPPHEGEFELYFADSSPFLLTNEASLRDLQSRVSEPIPMDRFRPNIVVAGTKPYEEDDWKTIRIGSITFPTLYACDRCSITTVDQTTADRGVEPLKTLSTYRKKGSGIVFGSRMVHGSQGILRIGDELDVLSRRSDAP